jgi:hypothetical protein
MKQKTIHDPIPSSSTANGITLDTVGSSPNTQGASLSGSSLRLEPASATMPGVVSTTNQSFKGDKAVIGNLMASGMVLGSNLSGTNTGDVVPSHASITYGTYTFTSLVGGFITKTASGNLHVDLPDILSVVPGSIYSIKDSFGAVPYITVYAFGANTIDGSSSLTFSMPYMSLDIRSNGTTWSVV